MSNEYRRINLLDAETVVMKLPEHFIGEEVEKSIDGAILLYTGEFKDLTLRAQDFSENNEIELLGTAILRRETRFADTKMPNLAFQTLDRITELSTPPNQLLAVGISPSRNYRVGLVAAGYVQGVRFNKKLLHEVFENLDYNVREWMSHHQYGQ